METLRVGLVWLILGAGPANHNRFQGSVEESEANLSPRSLLAKSCGLSKGSKGFLTSRLRRFVLNEGSRQ